jgi:ribonuclease HI
MVDQEKPTPNVQIFSDGSCKPNPGPGGWAAILRCPELKLEKELSGYEPNTTNNRMELTAASRALETLKCACEVTLTTDSEYLANAFRKGWLKNWKRNGWKTSTKEPVKNRDLWEALDALMARHTVHWNWTRGHVGHPENERCDELAAMARDRRGRD